MTECDEIADGLPLVMLEAPISMDEARHLVRAILADSESEVVIDNITQRYRERLNAAFDRLAAHPSLL